MYKKWYNNVLEASFLLNITVLSIGTYQVRLSAGNQAALVYTSVSVAFITFTVIVAHAIIKLKNTRFGKFVSHCVKSVCQWSRITDLHDVSEHQEEPTEEELQTPAATMSIVEIDQNKMSGFANYRETALDLVSL